MVSRGSLAMRKLDHKKALVLFSGGQDSSIALAWALARFDQVETVGFDYGQRHVVEMSAREKVRALLADQFPAWSAKLGQDTLINATGLRDIGETAMTHETEIVMADDGLPTTFVPGRNLLFMVLAGALGYRRNIGVIVAGMCEADYSGYPDCRQETLRKQIEALQLGMDADMALETPLMNITKADSWHLAEKIGGEDLVALVNEHSHTCYRGVREKRHDWGYGCGDCPACDLRAKGWSAYHAGA